MVNDRTIARLEARIKERAAYAIEFELNDPRNAFITITRTELARDLASVKVFYSVLGSPADRSRTAHMLESATGFVQRQLGRVLRTRRIPRITWAYDDSIEKLDRMDRAIYSALEGDRKINPGAHGELPLEAPTSDADQTDLADREFPTEDGDERE